MSIDQTDTARCGLSWAAKVVCSGVHVTRRQPLEILRSSCAWMVLPDEVLRDALQRKDPAAVFGIDVKIDHDVARRLVTLTQSQPDGRVVQAFARFVPGVGTVVLGSADEACAADGAAAVVAETPRSTEALPPHPGLPAERQARLDAAVAAMFAKPAQFTNAFVVLHRGNMLVERYAKGFDAQTRFESWSMGKSLAASMAGLLHARGALSLDEPAAFDEWQAAGDPRQAVRVRDLLNMASGLRFSGSYSSGEDESAKTEAIRESRQRRFLDHIYVYAGGTDSFRFCVEQPLEHVPGSHGRYRNCDPLLATALVRLRSGNPDPLAFLHWPHEELFKPLGMHGMLIEPDPAGHMLISGHDYGRARDWARLGQLYLQRGAWQGRQLLREDFVQFVQTVSPAWAHEPHYGGFFVTNGTGVLPTLPRDAYWASGGGGQRVIIVPSLELVVVRMGHMAGEIFGRKATMDEALGHLRAAVEGL
jgi:CubicO group peptidase (beta-lactamase class C family)